MSFPTRDNSYTQEEVNILESSLDIYTTGEIDNLIGEIDSGSGIDAFGILANTSTSANSVSTSGENIYWGAVYADTNVARASSYYHFSINNDDVSYVEVYCKFAINRASADGSYTAVNILMYNIGYSDDDGSSWTEDSERCGIIRVDNSTQYCTRDFTIMFPHTAGRVYRLRLDSGANIILQEYTASQSTINDADGDSYKIRRYPVWMRVKGY